MADRLKNSIEILQRKESFKRHHIRHISSIKNTTIFIIMLNDLILQDKNMEEEVQRTFREN